MVGARAAHHNNEFEPIRLQLQQNREEHAKKQKYDYSHVFRKKSRFDMIRLSCIIMGIEFAYAAETAFVSPILLEIGIEHQQMTMVWALSPLIGFFLAPLMGSLSDRCRIKLGRRRPFIIVLSLGIILGLFLVPYGKDIGVWFGDEPIKPYMAYNYLSLDNKFMNDSSAEVIKFELHNENAFKSAKNTTNANDIKLFAVIITILGVILLDFDADTCQTPSRAYLLDVCVPEDHAKCLSTFTIMAGLGGGCGYAIGGIDWNTIGIGALLGGNIKTVFTIVTIIFIIASILTVTSFREIPLPEMEKDELLRPVTQTDVRKELEKTNNTVYIIKETDLANCNTTVISKVGVSNGSNDLEKANKSTIKNDEDEVVTLKEYLKSIIIMPKSLRILCFTNFLCWMAHLCYALYFTAYVGEEVFEGDPLAITGTDEHTLFEDGVRFGCWGMAIYALSCSIYSCLIEYLIKYLKLKYVYIGGLLIFAIGMFMLATFPSKVGVLLWSVTAGIIYATLFTIPFILVAQYHAKGSFKQKKGENIPLQQKRGLGTDIAIISSMIFLAQITVSMSVGSLISLMQSTSAVIYAAGFCSFCASISALFVLYIED